MQVRHRQPRVCVLGSGRTAAAQPRSALPRTRQRCAARRAPQHPYQRTRRVREWVALIHRQGIKAFWDAIQECVCTPKCIQAAAEVCQLRVPRFSLCAAQETAGRTQVVASGRGCFWHTHIQMECVHTCVQTQNPKRTRRGQAGIRQGAIFMALKGMRQVCACVLVVGPLYHQKAFGRCLDRHAGRCSGPACVRVLYSQHASRRRSNSENSDRCSGRPAWHHAGLQAATTN